MTNEPLGSTLKVPPVFENNRPGPTTLKLLIVLPPMLISPPACDHVSKTASVPPLMYIAPSQASSSSENTLRYPRSLIVILSSSPPSPSQSQPWSKILTSPLSTSMLPCDPV